MRIDRSFTLLCLTVLLLAGCSGTGRVSHDSPEEAFQKGQELFEKEKYAQASEYLRGTFNYGRAHEWAERAQFLLARAYYENEEYIRAANEFNRFARLYRRSEKVDDADFLRAMCYFHQSPVYELDQTDTRQAIELFQLFLNRHPESEYVSEAETRIAELREKLARKKYASAKLYERRGMVEPAAVYFESVFDAYPDTEWADDALLKAIENYIAYADRSVASKQYERYQKAIKNYDRLVQLFPDSPLLKKAEALYEKAASRVDQLAQNQ